MGRKMNWGDIDEKELLASYSLEVNRLKQLGKEWHLSNDEIQKAIEDSFAFLEEQNYTSESFVHKRPFSLCKFMLKIILIIFCFSIFVHVLLTYHKPTYNFVVRNVQEFIYPTMKLLRWTMLPIVKLFPSITVWYDEICLVENPYFEAVDINCWACEEVRSVLDLSETEDPNIYTPHSGFPYVVKGASAEVMFSQIQQLYDNNKHVMDRDASRVKSSESKWTTASDFMSSRLGENPTTHKETHVLWRMNRLEPARVIRKLFVRPPFLPNNINVERFLLIDEPKALPYSLPFPEGYKVFLMQGAGERLVILEPVEGCKANCSRVSILMQSTDFLYYNSWFYRPKSFPVENGKEISVSYMGSY